MYLTSSEEKMLNGENGTTLQKAIEILVALGDIYGAESLIPVKNTQIAGVSYKTIGDAGLEWISDLKGKVKVPSILNPAGMDLINWQNMNIEDNFAQKQLEIIRAYEKLGICTQCTCTPYYLDNFDVKYGDHLAWSESSAVSYANSVIGARTNREGGPSALAAALVGKTANYGYHLDEYRVPNIHINVDFPINGSDYGALGYITGKIVGSGVPLFTFVSHPSNAELKALGAAMAASGAVALYHVQNVTMEAIKSQFTLPEEHINIEQQQIKDIYISETEKLEILDIITIGCPHCSFEEMQLISTLLHGKQIKKELWIYTSRHIANKYPHIIHDIEKSGAKVICDTCMVVSPATDGYNSMMVNSGKALAYVPGMCGVRTMFGNIYKCIEEALK